MTLPASRANGRVEPSLRAAVLRIARSSGRFSPIGSGLPTTVTDRHLTSWLPWNRASRPDRTPPHDNNETTSSDSGTPTSAPASHPLLDRLRQLPRRGHSGSPSVADAADGQAGAGLRKDAEQGLYVSRQVEHGSAQRLLDLADETLRGQGISTSDMVLVPPDKMHVTVVRSPNPLRAGETLDPLTEPVTIDLRTGCHLVRLGDGIALRFNAPALEQRWEAARGKGAGWAYGGGYIAHVTVSYDAKGAEFEPIAIHPDLDLTLLGERAETYDPNWVKRQGL